MTTASEAPKRGRGRPRKSTIDPPKNGAESKKKTSTKKKPAKKPAATKPAKKSTPAIAGVVSLAATRAKLNAKKKCIFTFDDDAAHLKANVVGYVSTGSVLLDKILLTGGLPLGRIVEIFGYEGVSKSTLGYNILKNVQEAGGTALLIDTERTATKDYLERIGLDCSENGLQLIQEKNLEEVLEALYGWLKNIDKYPKPVGIFYDSIAGTSTAHADKSEPGVKKVADMAGTLHKEFRILNEIFTEHDVLFVAANRRYDGLQPGGFFNAQPEIKTYGGKVFPFWASVRIEITAVMGDKAKYMWPWNVNISTETLATLKEKRIKQIGMYCDVLIHKNKTGSGHAGTKGRYAVQFGRGFDNYWSLHTDLHAAGFIRNPPTSAGWHEFTDKDPELASYEGLRWKHGHFGLEYLLLEMPKPKREKIYNRMVTLYNETGYSIEEFPGFKIEGIEDADL